MGSIQVLEFVTLQALNTWLNNQEAASLRVITPLFNTATNAINYSVEYSTELAIGVP